MQDVILIENQIMDNRAISTWFGVTPKHFTNNRQKLLNLLALYCDYTLPSRGSVLIKEVYITTYIKGWGQSFDTLFRQYALSSDNQRYPITTITTYALEDMPNYSFRGMQYNMTNCQERAYLVAQYSTPKFKEYQWYQNFINAAPICAETQSQNSCGGIYGIYQHGELIYIGLTTKPFAERWKEHKQYITALEPPENGMILYQHVRSLEDVEFKSLIELDKCYTHSMITRRDLEAMELGLITMYQPKYNVLGRSKLYTLCKPDQEIS